LLSGLLKCSVCGASYQLNGAKHYACAGHINGGPNECGNNARLHRDKAEAGVLEGIQRAFLRPEVLEEAKRRARALIRARAAEAKPAGSTAKRARALRDEVDNLVGAIAQGALRSSPAIAARLQAAEEELAQLEAAPAQPQASKNFLQQQARFDQFISVYNQDRPHQALNMRCPAELYRPSPRPYNGLPDLEYPFHDRTITVTRCGRICMGPMKINLSQAFAGQRVGVKQVEEKIWLVSFMRYDLGFFDHEACRIESAANPFAAKLLPMSPV
jgi:hypothetical protein